MKSYTLTLIAGQTNDFTVSLNGTALTTTQFNNTFFSAAGTAQFAFDTSATNFTIWDNSAMSGRSVAGTATIDSTKVYDVEWAAASGQTTNTFTSVVEDDGYAMTKYQISDLMGKVKSSFPLYEITSGSGSISVFTAYAAVKYSKIFVVKNTSNVERILTPGIGNTGKVKLKPNTSVVVIFSTNTQKTDQEMASSSNWQQGIRIFIYGPGGGNTGTGYCGPVVWYQDTGNWIEADVPAIGTTPVYSSGGAPNKGKVLTAEAAGSIRQTIWGVSSGSSAATWTTIGTSSKYTKRALQVTVNINETSLTLTANDWNTLFTLPSGYRPASELTTGCTMTDNGTLVNGLVKITTAGAVQVMAGSNTTEVYGLLTIPVAS